MFIQKKISLDLCNLSIEKIPPLELCEHLTSLNLSSNNISSVHKYAFVPLVNLEKVRLNNISLLRRGTLLPMRLLPRLDIARYTFMIRLDIGLKWVLN